MTDKQQRNADTSELPVDNSFTSVLWRRVYPDMRLPAGWTLDMLEKSFRAIVERTLSDSPPNAEAAGDCRS